MPKMLTSNMKIINEDKNCISPTQKFHFPCNVHKKDYLKLGGTSNNDSSRIAGTLVYGSSQKYKDHMGTENPPTKSGPGDLKLPNAVEDRGEGTSAFKKGLFRTCDNIHECDYANENINLDSHISPLKPAQTKISKEKSWNCSNSKQKLQYSTNKLKANDVFSASEIGENIFKVPSFSVASQPHNIQAAKFRSIFKEFPYFNYIQSKAFDDLLYTDRNFVICAPTGSGKTVVFEL
ncbi:hypothetical protein A6R68_15197, partial [Neotoma lepida]